MHELIILRHQLVSAFQKKYNVPAKHRVLGQLEFGGEFTLELQFNEASVNLVMYYLPLKDRPYVQCFSIRSEIPPEKLDSHFFLKLRLLQKDFEEQLEFKVKDNAYLSQIPS